MERLSKEQRAAAIQRAKVCADVRLAIDIDKALLEAEADLAEALRLLRQTITDGERGALRRVQTSGARAFLARMEATDAK